MRLAIVASVFTALVLGLLASDPVVSERCHTGTAFCGCPNKAACGQDDEKDCTSCCDVKCKGGSPATRSP